MSILDWFEKKEKSTVAKGKLNIPSDLWIKCSTCNTVIFLKDLEKNKKVCSKCNHHFRLTPEERIKLLFDKLF